MMILANGATPIQCFIDYTRQEGMVDHRGFVLASWRGQFVTWECGKAEDEDTWNCESGHYFTTLDHAQYDFGLRIYRALDTKPNEPIRRAIDQRARELLTS